ncbi:MAG: thiamine-phosphate kinase, partial [Nitrosopumilaceae archaeon]|nr:thiamine-phosphate kinase [Nitrosopumilaceae archaeon]NIP10360.1 thiamine-phosphate kinase [Nitrosopumilaceae archaeon]NIS94964.1 thiamine-phosphate kinase [Nitrosopumilaceae archaeon]
FVTGPFGLTGAGLAILLGKQRAQDSFAKKATSAVLQPKPRLEFGVKSKKLLTSAMDSSDGLSTTLAEMSRQSKSKFVIDHIPATNQVQQFCQKYKKDFDSVVFHTGEEYEFVFTIPKKHLSQIVKIANSTKTPIIQIGTVEKGKGVFVQKNEKLVKLQDKGYRHFR